MPGATLTIRGRQLRIDGSLVMGVVNASPESFSDGGRDMSRRTQLEHLARLVAAGADIVDIGGQSGVTNEPEIEAGRETERVLPLVEWLRATHPGVLISVDTYKPAVVRAMLAAGADIVNDVSGLLHPEVAELCAGAGAALVIMHTAARPKVRRQDPALYGDVAADVVAFLRGRMEQAVALGLPRDAIVLDPGPDFAKTPRQTVDVLRALGDVRALGRPVLLALSRKDFVGAIVGRRPLGRDAGSLAAAALLAAQPGNILRVHDVEATVDALRVVDVLTGRADIPADYLLPDDLRHEPTRVRG